MFHSTDSSVTFLDTRVTQSWEHWEGRARLKEAGDWREELERGRGPGETGGLRQRERCREIEWETKEKEQGQKEREKPGAGQGGTWGWGPPSYPAFIHLS